MVAIEVKGVKFYEALAERAGNREVKELFLFPAGEEKQHIKRDSIKKSLKNKIKGD